MLEISKKISFIKTLDSVDNIYAPYPTKKNLPDWYKKTKSFNDDSNLFAKSKSITIKKCIPIFDAISNGYIIQTYCDSYFYQTTEEHPITKEKKDIIRTETPQDSYLSIEYHAKEQAQSHPLFNDKKIPKFINIWGIKTPPGYSCLFINPMHNPNEHFTILEGIVDTDQYHKPVNFPFVFKNKDFNGLIPAGTPIAQVIPFKRDSWNMKIVDNSLEIKDIDSKINSLFLNKYKKFFWSSKEYN